MANIFQSGQSMTGVTEADLAKQARDAMTDILSTSFDRSSAYTNVIIAGGYAGAFTLWNFTREMLPFHATVWVAILLTISLACFAGYEIYKMAFISRVMIDQYALIREGLPPAEFLKGLAELEQRNKRRTVQKFIVPWVIIFGICVFCAVAAVAIILTNLAIALLTYYPWPV